jgi:ferritin-like protein
MSSEGLHEPIEKLSEKTINLHRAIVSLMEELEAVDWYQQRADACSDPELKAVLIHNAHEEIEHAMMVLEWIRRNHEVFDAEMKERLFSDEPITDH